MATLNVRALQYAYYAQKPKTALKVSTQTSGFTEPLSLRSSTIPYRSIFFNVLERLLICLPDVLANSFKDLGFFSLIVLKSSWFFELRTCAMDSTDSNHILGAFSCLFILPPAIPIVYF